MNSQDRKRDDFLRDTVFVTTMGGEWSTANKEESHNFLVEKILKEYCVLPTSSADLVLRYSTVRTALLGWEFANGYEYEVNKFVGESNVGFYRSVSKDCKEWPKYASYVCIRLVDDIGWVFDHADDIVVGQCRKNLFDCCTFREEKSYILKQWEKYQLPVFSKVGEKWMILRTPEKESAEKLTFENWIVKTGQEKEWASNMLNQFDLILQGHSRAKEEEKRESYGADVRQKCYLCREQVIPRDAYTTCHGHCKLCRRFVCGNHLSEENMCDECDQEQENKKLIVKKRKVTRFPLKINKVMKL